MSPAPSISSDPPSSIQSQEFTLASRVLVPTITTGKTQKQKILGQEWVTGKVEEYEEEKKSEEDGEGIDPIFKTEIERWDLELLETYLKFLFRGNEEDLEQIIYIAEERFLTSFLICEDLDKERCKWEWEDTNLQEMWRLHQAILKFKDLPKKTIQTNSRKISKWLSIVFLPSRNMIENITKIREKIGKDILKMYYYEFTGFPREDIEDDLETFIQQSKINYYQVLMPLSELPVKFYFNKRNQLLRYKQVLDAKNGSRKRIEDQLQRNLARVEQYVPLEKYQSFYMKCVTDHSFLPLYSTFTPKNANLEEGYGPGEDSIMFICNSLNKKKQKKPIRDCLKTIKMFELDYIDDGIITDPEMQNEEIVEAFDILIQRYSISNGSLDPLMSYEPDVLIRSGVCKFQVIYREMPEENKYCKEYLLPEIVHLVKKTFENKFEAVKIDYNSQEERDDIKSILETYKRGAITSSLEKSFVKFELYQPPDPDSNHYNTLYLLFADEEYKENAYNLIASITDNASSHQSDTSSEEKLAYGSSHSTFTRSFISQEDSDVTSSSSRIGTDESRLLRESNILNKYSKILSKISYPKSYSSFEVDQDKEEESKINFSAVTKFQKNLQYLTSNLGVLYTTQAIKNEYLLLNPPECKICDVREIELVKSLFNILKKSFNHSEQVQGLDSGLIGQMVIGELIKKSRYLFEPDSTFVWAFVGEDDSYKILDPNLNFYLETLYQEKILEYQDPISLSQTSLGSKTSGASSENASNSFLMTKKYYDLEGEHRIKVSIKTKRFEKHLTKKKYKDKLKWTFARDQESKMVIYRLTDYEEGFHSYLRHDVLASENTKIISLQDNQYEEQLELEGSLQEYMALGSDFQDLMAQLDISPETAKSPADIKFSSKLGANTMDHLTSRLKVSDESETYVWEEQGIKYFDTLITLIADKLFSCVDIDAVAEERMAGFKSPWIYLLWGYFKLVELAYTEKDHPILKPLKPYLDSPIDNKWMCTSVIESQPEIPEVEFERIGNGQIIVKDPVSVVMAACLGLAQPSLLKNVLAVFILKNRMKISRKNLVSGVSKKFRKRKLMKLNRSANEKMLLQV